MKRPTCEESRKNFEEDFEFSMVLEKFELAGNRLHLYGKSLSNRNKNVEFHNYGARMFETIIKEFYNGDVIIKKKGEDFIKIYHGRDYFKFTYICQKEYGEEITKFKQERF